SRRFRNFDLIVSLAGHRRHPNESVVDSSARRGCADPEFRDWHGAGHIRSLATEWIRRFGAAAVASLYWIVSLLLAGHCRIVSAGIQVRCVSAETCLRGRFVA